MKIKILILLCFGVSFSLKGQNAKNQLTLNQVVRLACVDVPLSPKVILKIKGYELRADNFAEYKLDIDPDWIKSIEVYSNSNALLDFGYEQDDTLLIIGLKKKKWRKLSGELKNKFIKLNEDNGSQH